MAVELGSTASPAQDEETFALPRVFSISTGHFIHDSYPAFLAPILPLLIDKLGISLAAAGGLVTILRWSSLVQPFVGHLADRTDARYFVIFAPTVTALGMSLLGIAPNYLAVVLLLSLTGLSHAAFHPAAAAMVTRASGSSWGRGLSFFMAGGELGRALGPVFVVSIVQLFGFTWTPVAALLGVFASILLYLQVGRVPRVVAAGISGSSLWKAIRMQSGTLGLLAGMIFFRSLAATSFATFLPTYYTSSGQNLWTGGIAITVYELAGALGAFFGGTISDRFGRKTILWTSQIVSVPLFWAVLNLDAPLSFLPLALAGLVALSTGPVQLALIQEILPDNRAAASGIVLFLGFEGTVVATLLFGIVADRIGLGPALSGSILLSLLSLLFTFRLPETRASVIARG